ncbi:phospholipase-like protein [Tanacetum coccineum]
MWWMCCGGVVVLVLRWWCCGSGGAAVVVVWCSLNMENYKDPPVTLTIRKFGREEFCLITGLRFGSENSDHYVEGINPYKRLLFGSDIDGGHITGQMLLDKINCEEFFKLQDEDAVAVCQLAVLHLILLGRQPAHNIPEWWFRLIVDKNKWETYPWGSYVWAKLYRQLRYANSSRWDRFYACQALPNRPPAKYTLSGFTWAFKCYPRAVAWSNFKRFKRENLKKFFDGARPNRKLTPDAFEAKAEWWVCSRDFFDGRIHEAPPIPSPINLTSKFDVPKYIDQRFDEQQQIIKELQKKNEGQDRLLNEMYNFYKGQSKDVDVREHSGGSNRLFLKCPDAASDFVLLRRPNYPKFNRPRLTDNASRGILPLIPALRILRPLWHNKDLPRGLLPLIRPVHHMLVESIRMQCIMERERLFQANIS